jgi:4-cresol dehydrogenase (hydroxylating)
MKQTTPHSIIEPLIEQLGEDKVIADPGLIEEIADNSLGLDNNPIGVVFPENTEEVRQLVLLANEHKVPLYPYSAGKNIGYGERMSVTKENLLVDLGRMNKIIHVDPDLGYADIEPGVTQGQLSEFLYRNGYHFYGDSTGSGTMSSIIGNFADGGFGTTPRGNKRKEMTCLKGVLGNGDLFDTGHYPGSPGPDLAGLFVQSNFGIITEVRQPLNAKTEDFRTMVISLKAEKDFPELIEALRSLKQQGTLIAQLVITNALDALEASEVPIPKKFQGKSLTNEDAQKILGGSFGAVGVIGGVYGSKIEVRARCKTIRRTLKARMRGKVLTIFASGNMLENTLRLFDFLPTRMFSLLERIKVLLSSLRDVHGMMQGIPSDSAMRGLLGSVQKNYGNLRLMWCSSHLPADPEKVTEYINLVRTCYEKHGYEFLLEMLMVTPNDIITLQKIQWEKGNEEQEKVGLALYREMRGTLTEAGFPPYRIGVQSQPGAPHDKEHLVIMNAIKRQLDPNNIISPGRYGIGDFE